MSPPDQAPAPRRGALLAGLRGRVGAAVAGGAVLVCAVFAVATYLIARQVLTAQRQDAALRQAYLDARFLRSELGTAGTSPADALDALDPQGATAVLLRRGDEWYSSSFTLDADAVPAALRPAGGLRSPAYLPARVDDELALVVAVPVPAVDATVYEIAPLEELQGTLRVLATLLAAGTLVAGVLGALLGRWLGRRALRPLEPMRATAAAIGAGDLGRRFPATSDPALSGIVTASNAMVGRLQERIERDARFAADVSHELRSPLTTLAASVELLEARNDGPPERRREALDLAHAELGRFQRLLEGLLELARADADPRDAVADGQLLDLGDLLRHVLRESGRPQGLLDAPAGPLRVRGDKLRLARLAANLLDNADRHGGGATAVTLRRDEERIVLTVDDAGPGVAPADRERVFERFATGGGPRASSGGTGLGLALVAETVAAHHGTVRCCESPAGGARFVVALPLAAP
ncbi:sensor histidine kinase [Motilibacter aurantiacus]|uniref:sensor histidine kinase n=1 Tax=Motilibacter aurantiacus TaxID=2714955 RepID=UPI0014099FB9|nr:HAMP domain-containing sensor histidine kinase [Motilibacter aurantiacus]NHC46512.1 HAMP domain-containing histidine kinase [Motilibacter aurantiacus]